MKMHKTLLGLVLISAFTLAGWTYMKASVRYTFTADSKMQVEGTSSIHAWKAEVKSVTGMMEISGASLLEGGTLAKANLTIPIAEMDCDNATMNKKMREALKADAHPAITYELVSARMTGTPNGSAVQIAAKGNLTLAGVQKPVEITLKGQNLGGGRLHLTGSYKLFMSDFDVKPPTAMLGALKTGDQVVIHFELIAEETSGI